MGQNNRNKFASNQVKLKIATSLASLRLHPSAFRSTHAFALHVWPFLTPELQQAHPKAQHENHLPMYKPLPSTRQPLPKRPENPSRATAVVVGRVHRGPRRDQLLDHGGVAFRSRPMQRRPASGAEDATRKAGWLLLPSRNKAYSHGMFLRVVGQKMWIGHIDRR